MLESSHSFLTETQTDGSLFGRKLKSWWQKKKISSRPEEVKEKEGEEAQREVKGEKEEEVSPWEEDYQLLICEGLFSEYLEMGESCPVGFILPGQLDRWGEHSAESDFQ